MGVSVLSRLAQAKGIYWGDGTGPDEFVARVVIGAGSDGTVTVEYEAWSITNGLQHVEAARLGPDDGAVTLVATSDGSGDTMVFREGEPGVFGSTGPENVGLVITMDDQSLSIAWWWPDDGGALREQSRARVRLMRPAIAPPPMPGASGAPGSDDQPPLPATGGAPDDTRDQLQVPWPGIVVLCGHGTGAVAQRLAGRLARCAVVRTDLFDRAVRGIEVAAPDPTLRRAIAVAVVRGYAEVGLSVILHGGAPRPDHEQLVAALSAAGLAPVRLVDVADGEDDGEVVRALIETT